MSEISIEDCKLKKWDIIDSLTTEEEIAAYLEAALEDGDEEYLIHAINDVARARGMNELAAKMGVSREGLYKSLNGTTKPRFETIYRVLQALGLQMSIKSASKGANA
jgi:probable addiction module antidote protein